MNAITDKPIVSKKQDLLAIEKYATALTEFIVNSDTPITVGLQGEWGTGKTSLMGLIQEDLAERNVATSWVNTWEYSMFRGANETTPAVLKGMLDKLEASCKEANTWDIGDEASKQLKKVGAFLGSLANQLVKKQTGVDVQSAARVAPGELQQESEIAAIKSQIAAIIDKLIQSEGNPYRRVVFFVDDLDRIPPSDAVEVLEALKNVFDTANCVYVLAIDYEVVVKGLESKFGKKTEANEREFRSFFDKIIQVPFTMPVGTYTVENVLEQNLGSFITTNDEITTADYTSVVRYTIGTNPRSLKRYLNSFSLLNQVRAIDSGDNEKTAASEDFTLFALLGLQVSYPRVYRLIAQRPLFPEWDEAFASIHSVDLESINEKLAAYGENELLDETWEKILWSYCQKEPYLKGRAFDVLSLLNFIREKCGEDLPGSMEYALDFATMTAIDDDQSIKSSSGTRKRVKYSGIEAKVAQLREERLSEPGIVTYQQLFGALEKQTEVDSKFRISFAGKATSFSDDCRTKGQKILLYVYNPRKSKPGLKIDIKPWVGDLIAFRERFMALTGSAGEEHIRMVEGSYPCLRIDACLAGAVDDEIYRQVIDVVVEIATS